MRSVEYALPNLLGGEDLVRQIQGYQRRLFRKLSVGEDRLSGLRVTLPN